MDRTMTEALDRHITGNYGEDSTPTCAVSVKHVPWSPQVQDAYQATAACGEESPVWRNLPRVNEWAEEHRRTCGLEDACPKCGATFGTFTGRNDLCIACEA